jgi:hypothetical protein
LPALLFRARRKMRSDSIHHVPDGAGAALQDGHLPSLLHGAGREMRSDSLHRLPDGPRGALPNHSLLANQNRHGRALPPGSIHDLSHGQPGVREVSARDRLLNGAVLRDLQSLPTGAGLHAGVRLRMVDGGWCTVNGVW